MGARAEAEEPQGPVDLSAPLMNPPFTKRTTIPFPSV